jgi:hypothetical protein
LRSTSFEERYTLGAAWQPLDEKSMAKGKKRKVKGARRRAHSAERKGVRREAGRPGGWKAGKP